MKDQEAMVVKSEHAPVVKEPSYSVSTALEQVKVIQDVMSLVLKDGEHYYSLSGYKQKALGKSGAEKLNLTFRMAPDFEMVIIDFDHGHREYRVKCNMTSIITGKFLGSGVGSCSTLEDKYRYMADMEYTDNYVPKDYWKSKDQSLLGGKEFTAKKHPETNKWVIAKKIGNKEIDNPANHYNTCFKMAKKRAMVDAVLTCTAASDIFTQDVEEDQEKTQNNQKSTEKPQKNDNSPTIMAEIKRMLVEMKLDEKEKQKYRDMLKEKGEAETFNAVSDRYAVNHFVEKDAE